MTPSSSAARLAQVALPDFGMPDAMPEIPPATYVARLERLRARAESRGLDRVVVYADREHSANVSYLTGFDPRFEEALLVIGPSDDPAILVGNECWGMAGAAPLPMRRHRFQDFSLPMQPRDRSKPLAEILREEGIGAGSHVGLVGWKSYGEPWKSDVPAYLVDELRGLVGSGGSVENATDVLIDAADGLRVINEVEQLAFFEWASCHTSQGVRSLIHGLRPGMSEREAVALLGWNGWPLSCHLMLTAGSRAPLGLLSPGDRPIERGDPFTTAFGIWGALTCRAGFVVEDAGELPEAIRDYVDRLVAPYFTAIAAWYGALRIGVTGGELQAIIDDHLGDPFFGIFLNPGHQLHLDEWVSSPIFPGSPGGAELGHGAPGGRHPGHRHRVLHDQHRGRRGPGRCVAARRLRERLPRGVGTHSAPKGVHVFRTRHRPPCRSCCRFRTCRPCLPRSSCDRTV